MSDKKKKGGLVFLIIVIILALAAAAVGILKRVGVIKLPDFGSARVAKTARGGSPIDFDFGNFKFGKIGGSSRYVARLYITGVIQEANESYNQQWLLDTIEGLEDDESNVGILLVIDSPGGTVYEADELYLALRKYKNSGKAVWAYFKSMAASGGYYIACAADTIYANRNTMTGSIGVIMGPVIDATELLDKIGIKANTFASGKNKGMLAYNSPVTDEQRKIMQDLIDEAYEQFVSIVAQGRQKSLAEVREVADGRIYTASQAKANGLIDSVGTLENAEDRMRERLAITLSLSSEDADAIEFCDYEYVYDPPFMKKIFESKGNAAVKRAVEETFGPDIKYPAYLFRN